MGSCRGGFKVCAASGLAQEENEGLAAFAEASSGTPYFLGPPRGLHVPGVPADGMMHGAAAEPQQGLLNRPAPVKLSAKWPTWPEATVVLPEPPLLDDEEEDDDMEIGDKFDALTGNAASRCLDRDPSVGDQPAHIVPSSHAITRRGIPSFGSDVTEWDYPIEQQAESNRLTSNLASSSTSTGTFGGCSQAAQVQPPELQACANEAAVGMHMGNMPMFFPPPLMMAPPPFSGGVLPPQYFGQLSPSLEGQQDLESFAAQQMEGWKMFKDAIHQTRSSAAMDSQGALLDNQGLEPGGSKSQRRMSTEALVGSSAATVQEEQRTTVMLRNLPNNYTRDMLLELLDEQGFNGKYDFVYLPVDFKRMAGLGYAFVNMEKHDYAEEVWKHFDGFTGWTLSSPKVCQVAWGDPLQGLEAHIERYKNSPVMHEDVEEMFKPVIFKGGQRQEFPEPTKRLKPPRMKYRTPAEGRASTTAVDGSLPAGGCVDATSAKFVD